jgi:hypothetical protein
MLRYRASARNTIVAINQRPTSAGSAADWESAGLRMASAKVTQAHPCQPAACRLFRHAAARAVRAPLPSE